MNIKFNLLIFLLLDLIVATVCACQKDIFEPEVTNDRALITKLYSNSSDTVKIDNQNLILETELYRNFTPGIGPINMQKRRLIAPVWLVNTDSARITQKLRVTKIYVVNNNQVWISDPKTNPDKFTPEYKSFLISKDGPVWEPGVYVDVIISVIDLADNKEKFIIAGNQIIERVE